MEERCRNVFILMELGKKVHVNTVTWSCRSRQTFWKIDHPLVSDVECLKETDLEYVLFYFMLFF